MRFLRELLRAAFVGFAVLIVCGGLVVANAHDEQGVKRTAEALAGEASERLATIFQLGVAGAIFGVITLLLLRLVGSGPRTRVALGPVLAAFSATLCFARGVLREGKVEDLAGVIVLAAIAGFFVALVDASRTLTHVAAAEAPPHDRI